MAENYWNSSLTGENIEATLLGAVRGDATQNKTAAWKTKARQNIGAAGADDVVAIAKGGTGGSSAAAARANLGLGTAAVADIDSTLAVSGAAAEAKTVGDAVYYKSGDTYANIRVAGATTDFPGVVTENNGVTRIGFTVTTAKMIPQGMTATVTRCNNGKIYGPNGLSLTGSINFLGSNYTITTSIRAYNLVKVVIDREGGFPNLSAGQCIVVDATIVLRFD